MSVSPESIALESLEASLSDMANLTLGSSCSKCGLISNSTCCCQLKSKEERKKTSPYPYFWRKTQNNPFLKSKRLPRTKLNGTFEILQPSKLKFIVGPSAVSKSNFDDSSPLTLATNEHLASSSLLLNEFVSDLPHGLSVSSSVMRQVSQAEEKLSKEMAFTLPDFTSLSLKGNDGISRSCCNKATEKLNEGTVVVESSGTLLNFKLESNARARKGGRTPKWKSRIRGNFTPRVLPPILEDAESDCPTYNNNSTGAISPSNANLNCSQQALMENGNGWTQESSIDPIDDVTIDELASYLDVFVYIPKKMSPMAEMMYT